MASLHLTPADREAWRAYQTASTRAAEQYHYLPISARAWRFTHRCLECGEQTYDPARVCWVCRGGRS